MKYSELAKWNREAVKDIKCPDCGGMLQGHYYGYSCCDCGVLFNEKLKPATPDDLI